MSGRQRAESAVPLHRLTATEAVRLMAAGRITSESLVRACLERIADREPGVRAWVTVDAERAVASARARDRTRPRGPLHGIPIGVKDVIDTADLPTTYGSALYRDHRPRRDATCVARTRAAGAIVLGKTVSTPFAFVAPTTTRNPHDLRSTPGGSSSGSAAAVADFMVPLALGTQTGGSLIRPASYCGVFAFKPTFDAISMAGVKPLSVSLDTLGLVARSADDLALFYAALAGAPRPNAPRRLRIGYCRTPFWKAATAATRRVLARAARVLGAAGITVEDAALPDSARDLDALQDVILAVDAAVSFRRDYARHRRRLGRRLCGLIERGLSTAPDAIQRARRVQLAAAVETDRLFDRYDALLTPAAPGEAEIGRTVGDAVFNKVWTAMQLPCLTIPGGAGPRGLPVGIQLVGRAGADGALLAIGRRVSRLWPERAPVQPSFG